MKKTFTDINDVIAGDIVTAAWDTRPGNGRHGSVPVTSEAYDVDGDLYLCGWRLGGPRFEFISAEREVKPPAQVGAVIDATLLDGQGPAVRMMLCYGEANCDHETHFWRSSLSVNVGGRARCTFRPEELDHFSVVDLAEIPFDLGP